MPPAKRRRVHGLGHDWRRRTFSRMAVGGTFVLRGMPGGTIQPAQQAAARSRFGYVGRCDSTNTTTGGTFVLWVMPDGTIHPAPRATTRTCFGSCRMVQFIRHNNRRRVRALVMPGGMTHPVQQAAARSCLGSCRMLRFIQHNNRRRVRASGHAGQYDSSSTTTGGTFVLRGMPGSTIHPAQQAAERRIALIHRAAWQSRCTSHILLL